MNRKKLKLTDLRVDSFITLSKKEELTLVGQAAQGRAGAYTNNFNECSNPMSACCDSDREGCTKNDIGCTVRADGTRGCNTVCQTNLPGECPKAIAAGGVVLG